MPNVDNINLLWNSGHYCRYMHMLDIYYNVGYINYKRKVGKYNDNAVSYS